MRLRPGEWVVLGGSCLVAAFAAWVGVLIYLKPPPVEYVYAETVHTQRGEAVFRREGCIACHEIFGNGASYGPSLDGVGSRRAADWLAAYLRAPWQGVSARPYRLRMPPYDGLEAPELASLVNYLEALRSLGRDGRIVDP